MKIVFSVYSENRITEEKQLHFSDIIETEMSLSQIDEHLKLQDRYHSVLEGGQGLAFWDIYCFGDFVQDVIEKVKSIPVSEKSTNISYEPKVLIIQQFNPGNSDYIVYPEDDCFFYHISRFECGASGFGAIIALTQSDPIFAAIIVETIKYFVVKLWRIIFRNKNNDSNTQNNRIVYFKAKRFYSSFEQITNIDKENCSIVELKRITGGKYKVRVRTIDNEVFNVKSTSSGKIVNLSKV